MTAILDRLARIVLNGTQAELEAWAKDYQKERDSMTRAERIEKAARACLPSMEAMLSTLTISGGDSFRVVHQVMERSIEVLDALRSALSEPVDPPATPAPAPVDPPRGEEDRCGCGDRIGHIACCDAKHFGLRYCDHTDCLLAPMLGSRFCFQHAPAPEPEERCPECDKGRIYNEARTESIRCQRCGGTGRLAPKGDK
jgi:hypothetical protein